MMSWALFTIILTLECVLAGEKFMVSIQTLSRGTDGELRIKFKGILGESNFASVGAMGTFSKQSSTITKSVEINKAVDSLLAISLTVRNGHSTEIGTVTVEEPSGRIVRFDFKSYITGNIILRNAESPDLSGAGILYSPMNDSKPSVNRKEDNPIKMFVTYKVNTTNSGEPTFRWYRSNPSNDPEPVLYSKNKSVFISSLKVSDSGKYFCAITLGESVVKTADFELKVDYLWIQPLQVVITGSSFIMEGSSVQMTCSGSSNLENLKAVWKNEAAQVLIEDSTSVSYSFSTIHRNDTGTYTCEVRVGRESKSEPFFINVVYAEQPRINGANFINGTIYIDGNQTAELTCSSLGNPPISNYTIKENGVVISTYGLLSNKFMVKRGFNNYTCIASNGYLKKETTINVNVTDFLILPGGQGQNNEGEKFWTTEMIVIVTMAIAFFLIFILLLICIGCLMANKRKREPYDKKPNGECLENNNNVHDSLKREQNSLDRVPKNGIANSQFSLSSEEYISSVNDVPQNPRYEETVMEDRGEMETAPHGKKKAERQDFRMHDSSKDKGRKKKSRNHSHGRSTQLEEGESSNHSQVAFNYHSTVEYC